MKNEPAVLCNLETGVCEIKGEKKKERDIILSPPKNHPLKIAYFTDPICSACWGLEPRLRKIELTYGDQIEVEYHMGGLLPKWNSLEGSDINSPKELAAHWDEASEYYHMPINGDVWLEDPLDSSYPPSIAFKAAQLQGEEVARKFLRRLREALFLEKRNISRWEVMEEEAFKLGMDLTQLKDDYYHAGQMAFEKDLELTKRIGVRGFPTLFFVNEDGEEEFVFGVRPFPHYDKIIRRLAPGIQSVGSYKSPLELLNSYGSLTAKELSALLDLTLHEAIQHLELLEEEHKTEVLNSKNGRLWKSLR